MERLDFKDDWPMPNDFMLEIGRLSATWGALESTVNIAIGKLSGFEEPYDYRVAILLAHANFKQRVDILETLFEQGSKEHNKLQNYEPVIKVIKNAQTGRNKFIHGVLSFNEDKDRMELTRFSARGKMKVSIDPVSINDIKEVTAKNHEAMCQLYSIITGVKTLPIWERNA